MIRRHIPNQGAALAGQLGFTAEKLHHINVLMFWWRVARVELHYKNTKQVLPYWCHFSYIWWVVSSVSLQKISIISHIDVTWCHCFFWWWMVSWASLPTKTTDISIVFSGAWSAGIGDKKINHIDVLVFLGDDWRQQEWSKTKQLACFLLHGWLPILACSSRWHGSWDGDKRLRAIYNYH